MIELLITCDRCGKQGADGKSVQLGLSVSNPARLHLCGACSTAFHSWCAAYDSPTQKKEKVA